MAAALSAASSSSAAAAVIPGAQADDAMIAEAIKFSKVATVVAIVIGYIGERAEAQIVPAVELVAASAAGQPAAAAAAVVSQDEQAAHNIFKERASNELTHALSAPRKLTDEEFQAYNRAIQIHVLTPYGNPVGMNRLLRAEQMFAQSQEIFVAEAQQMNGHFAQLGARKTAVLRMSCDAVVEFMSNVVALQGQHISETQGNRLRVAHARTFAGFEAFYQALETITPAIGDGLTHRDHYNS